ncbi:1-deoxy-D-xylulose-5-phosphate synthase [Candidatus Riflebacteria bacterium]
MKILPTVNNPKDLKKLNYQEKCLLSGEIRELLISSLSKNGGHLSGNLGVVELIISLHSVFDFSSDKIVFDVGHQSYVHKILTGRKEQFPSIRKFNGLCGFPDVKESPVYDHFGTGHSSTSISAIHGIAVARDKNEENYNCIALIGDGAMTGGMAYEAMNNAGQEKRKMIVVLNDNGMSISENVGSISQYLNRIRLEPFYFHSKDWLDYFLKKIPLLGKTLKSALDKVKSSLRRITIQGMLFEELGFKYLGPVDGYNFAQMEEVFEYAKTVNSPVLIHVKTVKGKGYEPAEGSVPSYHGCGAFDIRSGKFIRHCQKPKLSTVFGDTAAILSRQDSRMVVINPATREGSGLGEYQKEFSDRFYDVGIAEQHAMTFAAGLAKSGLKPVISVYSSFLQRAYDQVLHDVAIQNLNVTIAIDRAGCVEDGPTHHGIFDISFLRHIPNLVLMAPKDELELQKMFKTCLNYKGPAAFRYPRGQGLGLRTNREAQEIETLELGKSEILKKGRDLVFFSLGFMCSTALQVARILESRYDINIEVVNARFIKPLDVEYLETLMKRHIPIVTFEEHILTGGFGSAVMEFFQEKASSSRLPMPELLRIGVPDRFIPHGEYEKIIDFVGLNVPGIIKKIEAWPRMKLKQVAMKREQKILRTHLKTVP